MVVKYVHSLHTELHASLFWLQNYIQDKEERESRATSNMEEATATASESFVVDEVEPTSWQEQLKSFVFLGGLDALQLFPLLNLVIVGYGCIWLLPRWKYTPTVVLVTSLVYSLLYALVLLSILWTAAPEFDFSELGAIITAFRDPNIVFLGWVHYIAFDLLIARQILLDSLERNASWKQHLGLIVPSTFLTLMLGPCGFFLYQMVIAPIFLSAKGGATAAPKEKVIKRV